jgi:HTH-type transcriptional repressor of NAD biosynthesis genes
MKRGLVVGKFMPLHLGHQLLIDTALANCDELTIITYHGTDVEGAERMPPTKRMDWLRTLYPQAKNILALRDPLVGTEDRDDPSYANIYAKQLDFLGHFDVVFSSENYGEPFAAALGAQHFMVDDARELMPVSGTTLRSDLHRYRAYIDPYVYRSLIQKVVFVGTESVGKSTLAKACADAFDTNWVHEYGRELWIDQGLNGRFEDLYKIARGQYDREEAAIRHSNRYLFCDTNAWTTMMWSEMYWGVADSRVYDLVRKTKGEYVWFLCGDEFDWVQDGYRELTDGKAHEFQIQQEIRLNVDRIRMHYLSGILSVEERVGRVAEALGESLVARQLAS